VKIATGGTIRSSKLAPQFVYALAFVLIIAVLAFGSSVLFMPASTAVPPAPTPAPTSAPANYPLPSEPWDYSDPNYIGSYGG